MVAQQGKPETGIEPVRLESRVKNRVFLGILGTKVVRAGGLTIDIVARAHDKRGNDRGLDLIAEKGEVRDTFWVGHLVKVNVGYLHEIEDLPASGGNDSLTQVLDGHDWVGRIIGFIRLRCRSGVTGGQARI